MKRHFKRHFEETLICNPGNNMYQVELALHCIALHWIALHSLFFTCVSGWSHQISYIQAQKENRKLPCSSVPLPFLFVFQRISWFSQTWIFFYYWSQNPYEMVRSSELYFPVKHIKSLQGNHFLINLQIIIIQSCCFINYSPDWQAFSVLLQHGYTRCTKLLPTSWFIMLNGVKNTANQVRSWQTLRWHKYFTFTFCNPSFLHS